jgi:hypothetical protein
VSRALAKLAADNIVKKEDEEIGINPFFSDWTREVIGKKPEPKTTTKTTNKGGAKRKKGTAKDMLDRRPKSRTDTTKKSYEAGQKVASSTTFLPSPI